MQMNCYFEMTCLETQVVGSVVILDIVFICVLDCFLDLGFNLFAGLSEIIATIEFDPK
jgi:hypothetical protein